MSRTRTISPYRREDEESGRYLTTRRDPRAAICCRCRRYITNLPEGVPCPLCERALAREAVARAEADRAVVADGR